MKLQRIDRLFNFEKGSLQSSKCEAGQYDFITASADWKTHKEFSHDCEALIFAAAAAGSLGRTHYVNGKFITSDLCFLITPKDEENFPVDLQFYHIIFRELRRDIVARTKAGTSKESISLGSFGRYELPYFPIETQLKIKQSFVKAEQTRDSLRVELSNQLKLVSQLRQSFLREAVQGQLVQQDVKDEPAGVLLERIKVEKENLIAAKKIKIDSKPLNSVNAEEIPFKIPVNWTWCRLGEVGNLRRGKSKHRPRNDSRLFESGTYPFIQTGDVSKAKFNGDLITTVNGHYNEFGLKQSEIQKQGTLCITIAANIAECGFLGFDACAPDSIVCFFAINKVIEKYVYYFLKTAKNELERFAPATAQKNINLGILNELALPLPPLAEQQRIVEKLETLMAFCNQLEANIRDSKTQAETLLQVALKEALEPKELAASSL
jgi:type I restriction enzyme S subunit